MQTTLTIDQLGAGEYHPYFKPYIDLAGRGDVVASLSTQMNQLRSLMSAVDEETASVVHAPYQWTIKQVVGHLIDSERIFGCRAHRIACNEGQELPGFEQNIFVQNTSFEDVSLADLVDEWAAVRLSNHLMAKRWTADMCKQIGRCDGNEISARAIVCLLVGHFNHHLKIISSRVQSNG